MAYGLPASAESACVGCALSSGVWTPCPVRTSAVGQLETARAREQALASPETRWLLGIGLALAGFGGMPPMQAGAEGAGAKAVLESSAKGPCDGPVIRRAWKIGSFAFGPRRAYCGSEAVPEQERQARTLDPYVIEAARATSVFSSSDDESRKK